MMIMRIWRYEFRNLKKKKDEKYQDQRVPSWARLHESSGEQISELKSIKYKNETHPDGKAVYPVTIPFSLPK